MKEIVCPLCNNKENNLTFVAKERLIGTREQFNYGECSFCKAVFLIDEIEDFGKYYPEQYHCFDDDNQAKRKQYLLKHIYTYNFWWDGLIGGIVSKIFTKLHGHKPEQNICWVASAAKRIDPSLNRQTIKNSNISILDIWCGSGSLLKQLQYLGFQNLTGVEPYWKPVSQWIDFIHADIHTYVTQDHGKKYDIIILSHVLEHLYDHSAILQGLEGLLSERGIIIIAMPFTWKLFNKFRENRLSLDAPRHVIINSLDSFQDLIIKWGLKTIDIRYEQKWWDIFASEMYSWDIGFAEISQFWIKDFEFKKHNIIANTYNKQKQGWSSVTFFISK